MTISFNELRHKRVMTKKRHNMLMPKFAPAPTTSLSLHHYTEGGGKTRCLTSGFKRTESLGDTTELSSSRDCPQTRIQENKDSREQGFKGSSPNPLQPTSPQGGLVGFR